MRRSQGWKTVDRKHGVRLGGRNDVKFKNGKRKDEEAQRLEQASLRRGEEAKDRKSRSSSRWIPARRPG